MYLRITYNIYMMDDDGHRQTNGTKKLEKKIQDWPALPVSSGNGLGDDELICHALPPLDAACAAVAIGCCWLLLLVVVLLVVVRGAFGASVFRSKPSHDDKSDAHDLANHRFPLRALAATHQSQVALGELEILPWDYRTSIRPVASIYVYWYLQDFQILDRF